jgi:hypothetical protein
MAGKTGNLLALVSGPPVDWSIERRRIVTLSRHYEQ